MRIFASLLKPAIPVPETYSRNFSHLYQDIAWYGIVNGSVLSFLSIYAARIGATTQQIGLLSALPAIVSLVFALPAGQFLEGPRNISKSVFRFSILYRIVFLVWLVIPWLFAEKVQISIILGFTFLSSIPLTYLTVGFNALFADAVPSEWRGHVAGIRNVVYSLTSTLTTLGCGWILNHVDFPHGYQIVFGLGFVGALMSSINLYSVHPVVLHPYPYPKSLENLETPSRGLLVRAIEFIQQQPKKFFQFRTEVLVGPFRKTLPLLTLFHLMWYFPVALFPVIYVDYLHFSDQTIGIGVATFSAATLIASTYLSRLCSRWGYQKVTGIGGILFGVYPFFLVFSSSIGIFMIVAIVGGIAWALVGGSYYNYLLEKVPPDNLPPYLAWYNIGVNAAILLGSLSGPVIGNIIGYPEAMMVFGVLRVFVGLIILCFG